MFTDRHDICQLNSSNGQARFFAELKYTFLLNLEDCSSYVVQLFVSNAFFV